MRPNHVILAISLYPYLAFIQRNLLSDFLACYSYKRLLFKEICLSGETQSSEKLNTFETLYSELFVVQIFSKKRKFHLS